MTLRSNPGIAKAHSSCEGLIHTSQVVLQRRSDVSLLLTDLDAVLSVKDGLAALVHLDLGDFDIRGIDTDVDGLTVGLVSGAALHVDDVLLSVDSDHLALLALEVTTKDSHLIILADREGANLIRSIIITDETTTSACQSVSGTDAKDSD